MTEGKETPWSVQDQSGMYAKIWKADANQKDHLGWGQRGQSLKSIIIESQFSTAKDMFHKEYDSNNGKNLGKIQLCCFIVCNKVLKKLEINALEHTRVWRAQKYKELMPWQKCTMMFSIKLWMSSCIVMINVNEIHINPKSTKEFKHGDRLIIWVDPAKL